MVLWFIKWIFVAAIWVLALGSLTVIWFAIGLPSTDGLESSAAKNRRQSFLLLDANNNNLALYGDFYCDRINSSDLPLHLIQSVVSIEDRRFFEHSGVDLKGILRAVLVNIREGKLIQGGSTLTQQLAKNLFLTPERTIERKIKELLLAFWLEYKFEKIDILSIYLNRVYMGSGTYGVEAASMQYFGVQTKNIDITQAAMLAGLLRAPARYNPINNMNMAIKRSKLVLNSMVETGYLSRAEAAAHKEKLKDYKRRGINGKTHGSHKTMHKAQPDYFSDWVLKNATGIIADKGSDVIIETTLNPAMQTLAKIVINEVEIPETQVALIAMSSEGRVCAMVGGRDYSESQFNRATQALRQPGSAFKPIVYLPAIEAGLDPDTILLDSPITISGWSPKNFTGEFKGKITFREAFSRSINTTAVRVAENIGRKNVLQAARRLGITSELTKHPSISLGAGEVTLIELTAAYATFSNGGYAVLPYGIRKISAGTDVLFLHRSRRLNPVISSQNAATIDDLLRAVISHGTGRVADFGGIAAGKTGTSQGSRDAWFIGYTDDLVVGIWMGNDDGSPINPINGRPVTGGGLPAVIWKNYVTKVLQSPNRTSCF